MIVQVFYGEKYAEFLFGLKASKVAKFIYLLSILLGVLLDLETIYIFLDLILGMMVFVHAYALIAMSGNQVIIGTYGNLYTMMANFSAAVLAGHAGRFEQSVQERLELIDALLAKDPEAAERSITKHLSQARDMIRTIIEHEEAAG